MNSEAWQRLVPAVRSVVAGGDAPAPAGPAGATPFAHAHVLAAPSPTLFPTSSGGESVHTTINFFYSPPTLEEATQDALESAEREKAAAAAARAINPSPPRITSADETELSAAAVDDRDGVARSSVRHAYDCVHLFILSQNKI